MKLSTLGLRHVALNVRNPQISKQFYMNVLGMELEWEPDPENVYLTSASQDNLALHKASGTSAENSQKLDHMGFVVPTLDDVDEWFAWVKSQNVPILKEPKTHRDGARSFYFSDPDGIAIQMIFHPPIAYRAES